VAGETTSLSKNARRFSRGRFHQSFSITICGPTNTQLENEREGGISLHHGGIARSVADQPGARGGELSVWTDAVGSWRLSTRRQQESPECHARRPFCLRLRMSPFGHLSDLR